MSKKNFEQIHNQGLYTPEQKQRRDETVWTSVQAILAPLQFVVCLVSVYFLVSYLWTGYGYELATWSVIVKTFVLYTIMVTGAIWEKVVFGQYLFAPAFFWEDVVSFVVIGLHSLYLFGLIFGMLSPDMLIATALLAYFVYVINAVQFVWKLRMARLQGVMVS